MNYFENEHECLTLPGGFTIENRLDRVRFGDEDITCDRTGLARSASLLGALARPSAASTGGTLDRDAQLNELRAIHAALSLRDLQGALPERIEAKAPTVGQSIFGMAAPNAPHHG